MDIKLTGWVIFLSSLSENKIIKIEQYGYWTGKGYRHNYEHIPVTERKITIRTKMYTTKARAERALEKCLEKYTYVLSGRVEEVR